MCLLKTAFGVVGAFITSHRPYSCPYVQVGRSNEPHPPAPRMKVTKLLNDALFLHICQLQAKTASVQTLGNVTLCDKDAGDSGEIQML